MEFVVDLNQDFSTVFLQLFLQDKWQLDKPLVWQKSITLYVRYMQAIFIIIWSKQQKTPFKWSGASLLYSAWSTAIPE